MIIEDPLGNPLLRPSDGIDACSPYSRVTRLCPLTPIQFNISFHWPDSEVDNEEFLGSPLQTQYAPFVATQRPRGYHQTFQSNNPTSQDIVLTNSCEIRLAHAGITDRDYLYLVFPGHCFVQFRLSEGLPWKRLIQYDEIENIDSRLYSLSLRIRNEKIQILEPPGSRRGVNSHELEPSDLLRYAANEDWYNDTAPLDSVGWVEPPTGSHLHLLCLSIIPYGGSETGISDFINRTQLETRSEAPYQSIITLRDAIIPYDNEHQASYGPRAWEHNNDDSSTPDRAQEDEYPSFEERDLEFHRPLSNDELSIIGRHHRAPLEFLRFPSNKSTDPDEPQTYTSAAPCFGLELLRFDESSMDPTSTHVEMHIPLPKRDLLVGIERLNTLFSDESDNPNEERFFDIVTGFIPPKHFVQALRHQNWPRINQVRHIFGDAVDLVRIVEERRRRTHGFDYIHGRVEAVNTLVPYPNIYEPTSMQIRHHFDRMNWERILIASAPVNSQPSHVLHVDVRGYQLPALAGLYESHAGLILTDQRRIEPVLQAHCNVLDIVVAGDFAGTFKAKYESSILQNVGNSQASEERLRELFDSFQNHGVFITLNILATMNTEPEKLKIAIIELIHKFGSEENFLGVTVDLEKIITTLRNPRLREMFHEIAEMICGQTEWPTADEVSATGMLQPGRTWEYPGGIQPMPGKHLFPIYYHEMTSGAIPWNEIPNLNDIIIPLGYGRAGDYGPTGVNRILFDILDTVLFNKALGRSVPERNIMIRDMATYPNLPGPSRRAGGRPYDSSVVAPYREQLIVWWAETARIYNANLLLYHFSKWGYNNAYWAPFLEDVLPKITTTRRPRVVWAESEVTD